VANWFKRGFGALKETANLVSLTIVIAATLLTGDWGLLLIGLKVEGVYLAVALLVTCNWFTSSQAVHARMPRLTKLLTSYRRRLEISRAPASKTQESFVLDQLLLIVTVAGFVVIIFFGFGKHLLTHKWFYLTHAEGWEAGAIWWTGLFLVYYLFKAPPTRNVTVDKIIIVILVAVNALLLWRAWKTIGGKPLNHIPFVMGIAACFLLIDLLSTIFRDDKDIEKPRSRASLFWADIPMVFSFLVLYAYLKLHRDTEAPEVFVAGVVACQLLISNAVFIVMEFGFLRLPGAASGGG
jgi:hypothetical protein